MLASLVREVVTAPDGVSIIVRKLSGSSLEKASTARAITSMRITASLPRQSLREYQAVARETQEEARQEAAKKAADAEKSESEKGTITVVTPEVKPPIDIATRRNGYDRDTVLVAGIVSWGYVDNDQKAVPTTPEFILDLDEETAEFLFEKIMDLSLPPLKPEAEEKKS